MLVHLIFHHFRQIYHIKRGRQKNTNISFPKLFVETEGCFICIKMAYHGHEAAARSDT